MIHRSLLACAVALAPLGVDAGVYQYNFDSTVIDVIYDWAPERTGPWSGGLEAFLVLDEEFLGLSLAGKTLQVSGYNGAIRSVRDGSRETMFSRGLDGNDFGWGANWSDGADSAYLDKDSAGGFGRAVFEFTLNLDDSRNLTAIGGYTDEDRDLVRFTLDSAEYSFGRDEFGNAIDGDGIRATFEGGWTRTVIDDTPYFAPIPLPAGLPLLVAGLGVLGLLRRRASAR